MRALTLPFTIAILILTAFVAVPPSALAQDDRHVVSGQVRSDAGEPLSGVSVSGWTSAADGMRGYSDSTVTGADGSYSLRLGPGKGYVNVYYDAWGASEGREIPVDGDAAGVDFTLATPPPKTARLEGVVLDPEGNPVAGAEVQVSQGCCYAYPEGRGEVAGGSGEANATTASAEPASDDAAAPAPAIAPSPPSRCCYDRGETARTDDQGRWSVLTYGGPRQVTVLAKGFAQETVQTDAVDGETTAVEIRLHRVPARDAVLAGRVVDAATGLPVAGATVSASSQEWGRYASAETGADGSYSLRTLPGWTHVSVSVYTRYEPQPLADDGVADKMLVAPPADQYYAYARAIDLESGDNALDVRLEPKAKPTVVLIGYLVDPDAQQGIPGAWIHVWNQDTGDWGSAQTDGTGSYKLLVRPGHYSANAYADGHLGAVDTFVIAAGEAEKRADLFLPKGTTRYAPCDGEEDCGGGGIAYATRDVAMAESDMSKTDAPRPAPTAPTTAAAGQGRDATGGTAYEGSGGGLPAYRASAPSATSDDSGAGDDAEPAAKRAPLPFPTALAVLAAIGAALLVAGRRR